MMCWLSAWFFPGVGLLVFLAGAAANADVLLGWSKEMRQARQEGRRVSMAMYVPGVIGAIAMWNGPLPWMQRWCWVPLLLDISCIPYFFLMFLLPRSTSEPAAAGAVHSDDAAHGDATPQPHTADDSKHVIDSGKQGTSIGIMPGLGATSGDHCIKETSVKRNTTQFSAIPVGDVFLDVLSQERFVKVSETHARMLTQGNDIQDEFEPDDPVIPEAKE
ncbi:MAG: hypothetical protein JO142_03815 [Burkholderiales bacterium]|nr:hypothetical protein [Burkholderiales bacterium]